MTGSKQSPPNVSAERHGSRIAAIALAATVASWTDRARTEEQLPPYTVVGDAIPQSLTGAKGNVERGRSIVVNRQVGLCLLCHSGPFPEEKLQGTLAPDLRTAARLTEGQIRLRIADSSKINPQSIMPAYFKSEGLTRVAPAFRGKTVLTAEQIED